MYVCDFRIDLFLSYFCTLSMRWYCPISQKMIKSLPIRALIHTPPHTPNTKFLYPPHKNLTPDYCYSKLDIKFSKPKRVIRIFNNKMSQFF